MSNSNKENSRRIAVNTILLYLRMAITMVVSLFTSRVILNSLGVEDYGIYNVVGGVVIMFSFFTNSLSAAISRFLTFELGKNNKERLELIFSSSVNILLLASAMLFILIEIIGVWFLNTKLNIPVDRLVAANWVLQGSILVFVVNLVSVPYNASIISHEKMSAFAYISIAEVILKLLVAYSLYVSPIDKLVTYSILLVLVSLIIRIIYGVYCNKTFEECKYRFVLDNSLLKEMGSFAGWNMLGSGAYLFNTQGVNIITNIYFDVSINAARGIATQVEGVIKQFVASFTTAINPQITKSYAEGNKEFMFTLVCRGSKYSYFLMLIFAVPFIFEADYILKLWLQNVPQYTADFLRLTILGSMVDMLGNAMANAAWATGKVRRYYIYVSLVGCLVFPLTWMAFAFGMLPSVAYMIFIAVYVFVIFVKLYIIKGLLQFPPMLFYREVFKRIIPVSIVVFILPGMVFYNMESGFFRLVCVSLISLLSVLGTIYLIGLEPSEKQIINNKVFNRVIRNKDK